MPVTLKEIRERDIVTEPQPQKLQEDVFDRFMDILNEAAKKPEDKIKVNVGTTMTGQPATPVELNPIQYSITGR
jgi:hypothetical protein